LAWSADHRRHHKFVDHDDDPYDISRGLFHAHIGWLLFRRGPDTPLTWVRDLQKDRLAWLQHEFYVPIAIFMSFALPAIIGYLYGGANAALGAFLIPVLPASLWSITPPSASTLFATGSATDPTRATALRGTAF
jgi:stearoyl-CoA desaturase (delta-9 desaturase)